MRKSDPLLPVLLALLVAAAPLRAGAANATGDYRGELGGVPARLQLAATGDAGTGVLQVEGGLPTRLEGRWRDGRLVGTASNDQGQMGFELLPQAGGVRVVMNDPTAMGGLGFTLQVELTGPLAPEATAAAASPGAPPLAQPPRGGAGDPRLVGSWRYSQSYTSGEFTAVSEEFMHFLADGRCAYGAGRVMAGDAGTSGDSGRGDLSPCEWRSSGRELSIRDPGAAAWQPVGRYDLDAERGVLLQYLPNGSRRLWYRQ